MATSWKTAVKIELRNKFPGTTRWAIAHKERRGQMAVWVYFAGPANLGEVHEAVSAMKLADRITVFKLD